MLAQHSQIQSEPVLTGNEVGNELENGPKMPTVNNPNICFLQADIIPGKERPLLEQGDKGQQRNRLQVIDLGTAGRERGETLLDLGTERGG